jgi:hypothetical protein
MLQGQQPSNKRQKLDQALPTIIGMVYKSSTDSNPNKIIILLDSGASQTIIKKAIVDNTQLIVQQDTTKWKTVAGNFKTVLKAKIIFSLPTLHETRRVESEMHVVSQINNYDMIMGRDLLQELGIMLDFSNQTITWDYAVAPMKQFKEITSSMLSIQRDEGDKANEATKRLK